VPITPSIRGSGPCTPHPRDFCADDSQLDVPQSSAHLIKLHHVRETRIFHVTRKQLIIIYCLYGTVVQYAWQLPVINERGGIFCVLDQHHI
jgi:hypothetical protein